MLYYQEIKAFVMAWVLSDARIATGAFFWGESKRVIEAQKKNFPYFWVTGYNFIQQRYQQGEQLYYVWELSISIKGNSPRDDISTQEYWLDHTHRIMCDFLIYLQDQHNKGKIFYNPGRLLASPEEVFEPEDNWGWACTVQIALPNHCTEVIPESNRYQVKVLDPIYSTVPGLLSVDINGETHGIHWDESLNSAGQVIEQLVTSINANTANAVSASTDGSFLYLKSDWFGANTIMLDLQNAGNTHTWLLPLETS